jgi:hypothetical protein
MAADACIEYLPRGWRAVNKCTKTPGFCREILDGIAASAPRKMKKKWSTRIGRRMLELSLAENILSWKPCLRRPEKLKKTVS